VYNIDIVKEQIRIAAGLPLSIQPRDIRAQGHAIEFRINAEDPDNDFSPSPGVISSMHLPLGPWVRVDTHLEPGTDIHPYYDSLVAKLIVWGNSRAEAIARSKRALNEFRVEGIKTTIPFHRRVVENPEFVAGEYDTGLVERVLHA
jgi:acetyl-CoA carboxylase biotin carboxylase subunit